MAGPGSGPSSSGPSSSGPDSAGAQSARPEGPRAVLRSWDEAARIGLGGVTGRMIGPVTPPVSRVPLFLGLGL